VQPSNLDADDVAAALNSVAIHVVRRARTADRELGVPPGQLSALSVLVFGGDQTVASLAAAEQVTSPTMTRILDGLERNGLATRSPHPEDRRAMVVKATRKGRTLMERGRRNRIAVIAALLDTMTAHELAHVAAATSALARTLDR
jgi:DNA-binding MarR family transcriptional regulator